MKEVAKVVGINLRVLLLVTVMICVFANSVFSFMMMFWIYFKTFVCLITAIVLFYAKRPKYGLAFMIAMLIVPPIGVLLAI